MEGTGESETTGFLAPIESLRQGIHNEIHKLRHQITTFTRDYRTHQNPEPVFIHQLNTLHRGLEICHHAQSHLRTRFDSLEKSENTAAAAAADLVCSLQYLNLLVQTFEDAFRLLRLEIRSLSSEDKDFLVFDVSEILNRMLSAVNRFQHQIEEVNSSSSSAAAAPSSG